MIQNDKTLASTTTTSRSRTPLTDLLHRKGGVVIDGAMSTMLERLGANLNDALWSAKVLYENPQLVVEAHRRYYEAGADVAITDSYQATVPGFAAKGISREEAIGLIERSAQLAQEAREIVLRNAPERRNDLLIAGAVGPYGAFLADGSEYRGDYSLTHDEYAAFHRPRIEALARAGVDLFAVETQPKLDETLVILEEIERTGITCWVTFSIANAMQLADGTDLAEAARRVGALPFVEAVGMNCGPRERATAALDALAESHKPLVVYPNSGEIYDPKTKSWHTPPHDCGWDAYVPLWQRKGARLIGGCCRTLPADIAEIARLLGRKG